MNEKPQLFLNMIVGSFETPDMLKRAIDSVKDYVNGIYVTITYKEKELQNSPLVILLNTYKANISFFKWTNSFADARNFAMSQVPKGENNFIFWMDVDDVVDNPQTFPTIVEDMVFHKQAAVFFPYWYKVDLDKEGNVKEIVIEHKRERIIRHDGTFKWIGALHETLIEQKQENVIKILRTDFTVVHLTSSERTDINIERNIKILEAQVAKEEHKDPRNVYYLAKAYADKADMAKDEKGKRIYYDLAFELFSEYLEGSGTPGKPGYIAGSGWPEERANGWAIVAEIARRNKKFDLALKCVYNAITEDPSNPIHYIDLSMTYLMIKDYRKARHWLTVAAYVPQPETTIITTPRDLKTKALEIDYNLSMVEGKLEHAIDSAQKLYEILPQVEALKDRIQQVESLYAANRASQSIVYLGKYLEQIKEDDKLPFLVKAIPTDLQSEKFASEMRHKFTPARIWDNNEVAIVCGQGFEQWSPKSIDKGVGGSEEAVIYLSNELTKLGWKVTVYANPMQEEGNHKGVLYRQWYDLNLKDRFNVLVMWRTIGLADLNPSARFKLVWMHDYPNNADFTEERVNKVNKIAVLSEYHKSLLRLEKDGEFIPMPEEKIFLTANGIILEPVSNKIKRNPYRMIYTSSYDRGLVYLLVNWASIKQQVPQAELHIFYGWNLFDTIHGNNPARMKWKEEVKELMRQDGVIEHGRIGHKQLAEEFMKSGIFAYPSDFSGEISTISAMKAQAYGTVPVVVNRYSLANTVKNGLRLDVDIETKEGQEEYVRALVKLLNNPKEQEEIRKPMMEFAQGYFLWSRVAQNWHDLFKYLREVKSS